jgi:hypothetical protein
MDGVKPPSDKDVEVTHSNWVEKCEDTYKDEFGESSLLDEIQRD